MNEAAAAEADDFVRVARCATPTEAHLLKGVLESAGLAPVVADAHVVQANSWMTQAVGGVRVLVPATQQAAALEAIAAYDAGAYALSDEPVAAPQFAEQPCRLFSPDRAVVLSLALTPAFGAAVQIANAHLMRERAHRWGLWAWFLGLLIASVGGVALIHALSPGPTVIFRASWGLLFITALWYFAYGKAQCSRVLGTYGPHYRKRSLAPAALLTGLGQLAVGWLLSELA